eukprot:2519085-Prymnesium_polylepis.2
MLLMLISGSFTRPSNYEVFTSHVHGCPCLQVVPSIAHRCRPSWQTLANTLLLACVCVCAHTTISSRRPVCSAWLRSSTGGSATSATSGSSGVRAPPRGPRRRSRPRRRQAPPSRRRSRGAPPRSPRPAAVAGPPPRWAPHTPSAAVARRRAGPAS